MRARSSRLVHTALALVLGLVCPPRADAAWPHDPLVNLRVAPSSAAEFGSTMVPDGAGGAIVAWTDSRNGNLDIFAQHLAADGTVAGGWPAGGLAICTSANDQSVPAAVADGSGGAIITWADARSGTNRDVYAVRVTGGGTFPGGWPVNGRQLLSDTHDEFTPVVTSDGSGGAIVAWGYQFTPGTDIDIYGARVDASGTVIWAHSLYGPLGIQDRPAIVSDGAGGAIVTYENSASGNYNIEAMRYNAFGNTVWGSTFAPQVPVSTAAGDQANPIIVADGAGGALMAWTDLRGGSYDIYAQRITAAGTPAPGWLTDGNPVCTAAVTQNQPAILADGAGGAIIAWSDIRNLSDYDIYAQRMGPGGGPSFGWPVDGVDVSAAAGNQVLATLAPDGAGGAIIAWEDGRLDVGDVFAERVTAQGTLAPGGLFGGAPICTAPGNQGKLASVPDNAGGAILAWQDARLSASAANIYVQSFDHFGQLGDARPSISSIRDVKLDQGGQVRLVWNASYLDSDPVFGIGSYWIWRQTPASVAQAAVARGGCWLADEAAPATQSLAGRRLFRTDLASTGIAWEFLVSQPVNGSPQYSYVATTVSDSMPSQNPYTVFMVEAHAPSGGAFWDSAPDSGYSVDNLGPATPAPFTGAYMGGGTHLHWGANVEADFAVYRVYRGSSPDFVPGPGSFVVEQPDTGYVDLGAAGSYYKLAALDIHGNVSRYAVLAPSATTEAGPTRPTTVSLAPPSPNPATAGTIFRFAVPRDARVRLALFDVSGREVCALKDGEIEAGEYSIPWGGRDGAGRTFKSGIYFIRLVIDGRSLTRRFVVAM